MGTLHFHPPTSQSFLYKSLYPRAIYFLHLLAKNLAKNLLNLLVSYPARTHQRRWHSPLDHNPTRSLNHAPPVIDITSGSISPQQRVRDMDPSTRWGISAD